MPIVQSTYAERHARWTDEGFEPDTKEFQNVSRTVETSAGIGWARAVGQGTDDHGCVLGGPLAKFLGITVMDKTLAVNLNSNPKLYPHYAECPVKTRGPVVVKNMSGQACAASDPVYYDPTTGLLANLQGAVSVGAPAFTGTGNGVLTRATPAYGANAVPGTYTVLFTAAAADAGSFVVLDPTGQEVGDGTVGVAFTGGEHLHFTIADGSTDFTVGSKFTLVVSIASEGPIPGARWETSALDAALAVVNLGIQK